MTKSTNEKLTSDSKQVPDLLVTGERFLPHNMSGDIELEHLHRYALALELAHHKSVLDIASGEGYGSHLLAQVADAVIGVDISLEAVDHAKRNYKRPNLEYRIGSCAAIPVADHSIDLVVSFETIEHHAQHEEMFSELKRVLKPYGILIISSPDKLNYSDARDFKNEFHVKELYFDEFQSLLKQHFRYQKFQSQRIHYGSIIAPMGTSSSQFLTFKGNTETFTKTEGINSPYYFIAYASDTELPPISSSIFDGTHHFLQLLNQTTSQLIETHEQLIKTTQQLSRTVNSIYWRITYPIRQFRKWIKTSLGL